jgi:hypothetical protein
LEWNYVGWCLLVHICLVCIYVSRQCPFGVQKCKVFSYYLADQARNYLCNALEILKPNIFIDSLAFLGSRWSGWVWQISGVSRRRVPHQIGWQVNLVGDDQEEGSACEHDEWRTLAGDSDTSSELHVKHVGILMVDHFICRHNELNCAWNYSS